jgi:hypothetical protein
LLSELDPASPDLPPQQRAQIDALTPSTRQWTTSALEFLAPTQTLRPGNPGGLGNKPLVVVTAGNRSPVGSSSRTIWPPSRPTASTVSWRGRRTHPCCTSGATRKRPARPSLRQW